MDEITNVRKYFAQRHIVLNNEWEEKVIRYIKLNIRKVDEDIESYNLPEVVFEQWLYSDIRESTRSILNVPAIANRFVLVKPALLQLMSILDISETCYTQYRNKVMDLSKDDSEFHDPSEVPIEQRKTKHGTKDIQSFVEAKKKPIHMYEFTDGNITLKAILGDSIYGLDCDTILGAKVLLLPKTVCRNRTFKLTSKNCQFLGGCSERVIKENSPLLKILCRKLDLDHEKAILAASKSKIQVAKTMGNSKALPPPQNQSEPVVVRQSMPSPKPSVMPKTVKVPQVQLPSKKSEPVVVRQSMPPPKPFVMPKTVKVPPVQLPSKKSEPAVVRQSMPPPKPFVMPKTVKVPPVQLPSKKSEPAVVRQSMPPPEPFVMPKTVKVPPVQLPSKKSEPAVVRQSMPPPEPFVMPKTVKVPPVQLPSKKSEPAVVRQSMPPPEPFVMPKTVKVPPVQLPSKKSEPATDGSSQRSGMAHKSFAEILTMDSDDKFLEALQSYKSPQNRTPLKDAASPFSLYREESFIPRKRPAESYKSPSQCHPRKLDFSQSPDCIPRKVNKVEVAMEPVSQNQNSIRQNRGGLNNIKLKDVLGKKSFQRRMIHPIHCEIRNQLSPNNWSMLVKVSDDSFQNVKMVIGKELLTSLLGFDAAHLKKAMDEKNDEELAKCKEAAKNLRHIFGRSDLVYEVEFSGSSLPVIQEIINPA